MVKRRKIPGGKCWEQWGGNQRKVVSVVWLRQGRLHHRDPRSGVEAWGEPVGLSGPSCSLASYLTAT